VTALTCRIIVKNIRKPEDNRITLKIL